MFKFVYYRDKTNLIISVLTLPTGHDDVVI